jgi:glutathione S-transferase
MTTPNITVWGRLNSSNVQKVVWALDAVGLAYRRVEAGRHFGVNNTDAYRDMNPTGLVPTYKEGDFVLWESNAIVRYIGARYGLGTICPEDLQARADADRWMDWAATTYVVAIGPTFTQLYRVPKEKQDLSVIPASRKATIAATTVLDKHLSKQAFVAGERFTMADIALSVYVYRWFVLPELFAPEYGGDGVRPAMPHVEAWIKRLEAFEPFRKYVAVPIT